MSFHFIKYKLLIITFLASLCCCSLYAKKIYPKYEFRAAWIATVSNIDWPSKPGLSAAQQQSEFVKRLDQLVELGCNVAIVQIRPAADAFYPSSYEPWSRFLSGKIGQAPSPYYDALAFMIEETHKRNIEFHAWFNPFRALTDATKNANPATHATKQHKDWVVNYGGKSYFNPGLPQVRKYVQDVILEVVRKYDIDAVHLDDYFYPYRIANVAFNDALAFNNYNPEQLNREDWRRQNVSTFIKSLNKEIKKIKPYCKLGISPFGVWRNASVDPEGSATKGGQTCFDDLYADIRLWMEKEWIDYALPQLYWEIHHKAAAFEVLLPWWETHKYQRHMYYGLGVYRMLNGKGVWASEEELKNEIELIRKQTNEGGFSFYSLSCFDKLNSNLVHAIAQEANPSIAFVPSMPWLDQVAPDAPILKKSTAINHNKLIAWEHNNPSKELIRFAVYRFKKNEPVHIQDNEHLIAITKEKEFMNEQTNDESYVYCVTALDRNWNESKVSNLSW
jgi:uncharacterized lipoprotein YddW (UPF0748 family)